MAMTFNLAKRDNTIIFPEFHNNKIDPKDAFSIP